jgi:hypothetical protein
METFLLLAAVAVYYVLYAVVLVGLTALGIGLLHVIFPMRTR